MKDPQPFPYKHSVEGVLKSGALTRAEFDAAILDTQNALEILRRQGREGHLPMLEAALWAEDIAPLEFFSKSFRRFRHVLVIGTGGASLAGKTFVSLFQSWVMSDSAFPSLFFLDNMDPEIFWEIMSVVHPESTGVIVISKSGETPETLLQMMRCIEYWYDFLSKQEFSDRFLVITGPQDSILRRIAQKNRFPLLEHPAPIGGRFSAFTCVGLLPAMITGADPKKIRHGGALVLSNSFSQALGPTVEGAAALWGLYQKKNITQHVMMPYGDAFSCFVSWYRQLLAESLGKSGHGFSPISAMGPVDQHSQLQLYLDGPKDKFFTLMVEDQLARERPRNELWNDFPDISYLACAALEDLVHAQFEATRQALLDRGAPLRQFHLSSLNESSAGALIMHFMVEILLLGVLQKIDPFSQSAVDAVKGMSKKFLIQKTALAGLREKKDPLTKGG